MDAIPYVAVPGTWAWGSNWYTDGPWTKMMLSKGYVHFKRRRGSGRLQGFRWSTDLSGAGLRPLLGLPPSYRDWVASGFALCDHVDGFLRPRDTNIICHSHGLQPTLVACALGMKVNCLVSVMSPPRLDICMDIENEDGSVVKDVNVLELARPNINYWIHLHSDSSDHWARRGLFGDGKWFNSLNPNTDRSHPWATKNGRGMNIFLKNVSHSRILNEPELFKHWDTVLAIMEREREETPFLLDGPIIQ